MRRIRLSKRDWALGIAEKMKELEFGLIEWLSNRVFIKGLSKKELAEALNSIEEAKRWERENPDYDPSTDPAMPVGMHNKNKLKQWLVEGEQATWAEIKRRGLEPELKQIDGKYYFIE